MMKEDAPVLETPKMSKEKPSQDVEIYSTTSTLPMDQVMETIAEESKEVVFLKKRRRNRIVKYVLIGLGALLVVGGIIVLGFILFWRN